VCRLQLDFLIATAVAHVDNEKKCCTERIDHEIICNVSMKDIWKRKD
jgi:hypothetical protein